MKILITGGAGYVGTRLSNHLYRMGQSVRVLDTLIYGNRGLHKGIQVIQGDITVPAICNSSMQDIDVVYHLAAISNDPTGNLDPELTHNVNFNGTQEVIKAAKKAKVKRFIFASSSSVLGIQKGENVTEETPPNPLTPYSETKLKAENLVRNFASEEFVTVAIRPATICGPSPRQRFDLAVNALTGDAFFDEKITVFGGEQRRPNITMTDMIHLYEHLLHTYADLVNGEVFNAGWENKTILQMAELIQEDMVTRSGGTWPEIEIRPVTDQRDYHINSGKIKTTLNWRPKYKIIDMVRELTNLMALGYITDHRQDIYYNLKIVNRKFK